MRTGWRPYLGTRVTAQFAPLALRLVWGIIFFAHGALKFAHKDHAVQFFSEVGIPLPDVAMPLVALLEIIGAIGLLLGLGTRLFALLLAVDMLVAMLAVRLKTGLVGGYEFELALLAGCITLALSGPGIPAIRREKGT